MNIPSFESYPFDVRRLSDDDGGGFLITFPDLPGCMADGETPDEAIREGRDAFRCWMLAHVEDGRPIPAPSPFVPHRPKSTPAHFVHRDRMPKDRRLG